MTIGISWQCNSSLHPYCRPPECEQVVWAAVVVMMAGITPEAPATPARNAYGLFALNSKATAPDFLFFGLVL